MKRPLLQYFALALLLVGLPALSWYYLDKGFKYRLETLDELGEFGSFPSGPYEQLGGDLLEEAALDGKVLVLHRFASPLNAASEQVALELGKIHQQFDERPDVRFLLFSDAADSAALLPLLEKNRLTDPAQVDLLRPAFQGNQPFSFVRDAKSSSASWVVLADTSGVIRQYYDFTDGNRIRRLVEHIATLMPVVERAKPVLKREKEK
ncbi:MAG: hypothetical protein IPH16_05480 [Haliscomenobacter sp.]|nr:hypothetical protein [Haliscomenobacter sp.]